jgi:uncharacterized protein involved in exopolysaccharide biosynthesis
MYYQRPLGYRILESVCRHWRLFACTSLAIIILLVVFVASRPRTYSVQCTVELNGQSITNPLSNSAEPQDWNAVQDTIDHFQTLVQTKQFVLDALSGPDGKPLHLNHPIDFNNADAIASLQKAVQAWPSGADSFNVSLSYTDPDDSVTILKALIGEYIDSNAQVKSSFYTDQVSFIGQQVDSYKDKLAKSEAALAAFKAANVDHEPGQQEAIEQQLVDLKQQLQQAQVTLAEDTSREQFLTQQISQTPKQIVGLTTAGASPLEAQLSSLEDELDTDQSVKGMKPSHPEVQALTKQIANLRAQIVRQSKAGNLDASGVTATNTEPNPIYVTESSELSNLRTEELGLQSEIASMQALIRQNSLGVMKVPEEERILDNLERDYSADSDQYNLLYKRYQEAVLDQQIYLRQQRGMYYIYMTGPPTSSANKEKLLLLFAGGVVLAFLVSMGLVVLSEAADRSFRDPYDLQQTLGVPVLAMLPECAELQLAGPNRPLLGGGRGANRLTQRDDAPMLSARIPGAYADTGRNADPVLPDQSHVSDYGRKGGVA